VIDSRASREGATIRRRRLCASCGHRYTTYEQVEERALLVVKRDGRHEEFAKNKLLDGIKKACQKRPITPEAIAGLVERVSGDLHDRFDGEVPSLAIGERVMDELRALDAVAYVRFSSVYRRFEEAADFLQAVKKLEVRRDTLTYRLPGF